ncbi:MAG: oligosaccharide flippase family protein [Gammaproteobacteria bacterium]
MLGSGLRAQLLRGGAGTALIQVTNRVLALALGIVLARSLGADGYGVYAYAFAIMSLLMVVAEAGVPTLLIREVATRQSRQEWGLLRGALIRGSQFVAIVSTLVSVIGLAVLGTMAEGLSKATLYTTVLMLLVVPLAALGKTAAAAMRGLHHVVVGQAVDLLLRPAMVLAVVGSLFVAFPGIRQPQYAMAVQLGAALVVLIVAVVALQGFLPISTRTALAEYRTRQWLKSAAPFLLIGGAGIIKNQTDIVMLGWFRDAREVGIYRVAMQGGVVVAFFLQAASSVLAPHFAKMYIAKDIDRLRRLYRRATLLVLCASLPIALMLMVFGGQVVSFTFGSEFRNAALPLSILSGGYLLSCDSAVSGVAGYWVLICELGNEEGRTYY